MTYSLTPATGFHSITNCVPTRVNLNAAGGEGGPVQAPPATMTTTSFDAALVPAELRARTRTK
jgi:hypothetical protein